MSRKRHAPALSAAWCGMCGLAGQGRQLRTSATIRTIGRAHSSQGCKNKEFKQRCGDARGLNPTQCIQAHPCLPSLAEAWQNHRMFRVGDLCGSSSPASRAGGGGDSCPLESTQLQRGCGAGLAARLSHHHLQQASGKAGD